MRMFIKKSEYFEPNKPNNLALEYSNSILRNYYPEYINNNSVECYLKYFDKFLIDFGTPKSVLDEIQATFRQININNTTCKQIVYIWTYINLTNHKESVIYVGSTMRDYYSRYNCINNHSLAISYSNFETTYSNITYFKSYLSKHLIDIQNNFKLYCFEVNDVLDNKNKMNLNETFKAVRQLESNWITKLLKAGNPLLNVKMEGNVLFNVSLA